jgi:YVTN family beta-propeller protein
MRGFNHYSFVATLVIATALGGLAETPTVDALPRNKIVATIPVGLVPLGIAVSPDSQRIYVANGSSDTVSVISGAANQVVATVSVGQDPQYPAVSPDSQTVYVTNYLSKTVSVISATSDSVIATVPVGNAAQGLAVSPSGNEVYIANSGDGTVSVVQTNTYKVSATITVEGSPILVTFAPSGEQAYVLNSAGLGFISEIDTNSRQVVTSLVGAGGMFYPQGFAMASDGSALYVTDLNNFAEAIDLKSDDSIKAFFFLPKSRQEGITDLGQPAVTPDGKFLYVARQGTNTVWAVNTATGDLIGKPIEVGVIPFSIAAAPNGKYVYVVNMASGTVTVLGITPG